MPLLYVKSMNPIYRNSSIGVSVLTLLSFRGLYRAVGWIKFGFCGLIFVPSVYTLVRLAAASTSFVRKIDLLQDGKTIEINTLLRGLSFELDIDSIEDPDGNVEQKMMMAMINSYVISTTSGHTFLIDKSFKCYDKDVLKEVLVGNEIEIRPEDDDVIDV